MAHADKNDLAALSMLLEARVPASWPPQLYDAEAATFFFEQLKDKPEQVGWWSWYFVLRRETQEGETQEGETPERVLIGVGGFKGAPDENGQVEVGYSVLDPYQRQGFCSEAVAALIAWAWARGVQKIVAETLPHLAASIRVLEKNGFDFQGAGSEEGVISYQKLRPSISN